MTQEEAKEMGDKIISLSKELTDVLQTASKNNFDVTLHVERKNSTTEDIITKIIPLSITRKIEIDLTPTTDKANW